MTREERNALVLSLLEHVTPILRKSASVYRLDYCCLSNITSLFRLIYFPVDRMEALWKRVFGGLPLNGPDT
jgi:hypothetical protein